MIVTVTVNPSLDRTLEVAQLRRGEVHRTLDGYLHAGGKGVNVSRVLVSHRVPTMAVLAGGGHTGHEHAAMLEEAGVPVTRVPVGGTVRTNLTVAEPDGTVTKINESGSALAPAEIEALLDTTATVLSGATDWVCGCGSLPQGMPDDFYARLVRAARDSGARTAVDSSGAALAACLPAGPDLVKPNRDELAECSGLEVTTLAEAVKAAEVLRDRGAGAVLASLGADGAILVDDRGTVHARARLSRPVLSTVGAGDATLAGFLAAGGSGTEALTEAVAWGAAAVTLPGSHLPAPDDLDRAAVEVNPPVDPNRQLRELS